MSSIESDIVKYSISRMYLIFFLPFSGPNLVAHEACHKDRMMVAFVIYYTLQTFLQHFHHILTKIRQHKVISDCLPFLLSLLFLTSRGPLMYDLLHEN